MSGFSRFSCFNEHDCLNLVLRVGRNNEPSREFKKSVAKPGVAKTSSKTPLSADIFTDKDIQW